MVSSSLNFSGRSNPLQVLRVAEKSAGNGVIDKDELKLLLETVEDGFACPTTVS